MGTLVYFVISLPIQIWSRPINLKVVGNINNVNIEHSNNLENYFKTRQHFLNKLRTSEEIMSSPEKLFLKMNYEYDDNENSRHDVEKINIFNDYSKDIEHSSVDDPKLYADHSQGSFIDDDYSRVFDLIL